MILPLPSGRNIPASFDPGVVAAIDAHVAEIERDDRVRLPLVIESGSRAWGFRRPTATMIAASSSSGAKTSI
jgi:hypothetical protein